MALTVLIAPCSGCGKSTMAYEILIHKLASSHAEEGMIIDVSLDEDPILDVPGCLAGFLLGKMHPADTMVRIPGFHNVFYSRYLTGRCKRLLTNGDWSKFLHSLEKLTELFAMELISHLEKGAEIVLSIRYNIFTEDIVRPLLRNPLIRKQASIIIVGNESKKCLAKILEIIENLMIESPIILINKVPAAHILNVKEDVMRLTTFKNILAAFVLPLSKQLYYRDFKEYVSVFKRAQMNPHARVISELFKRLVLTINGGGEKGKIVALIGGLLNATPMPNLYQLQGSEASSEARPFVR